MPRIDREVLEEEAEEGGKKKNSCRAFKAHLDISCLLAAHLHLAALARRGRLPLSLLEASAAQTFALRKSRDTFVFYKVLPPQGRCCLIYRGPSLSVWAALLPEPHASAAELSRCLRS